MSQKTSGRKSGRSTAKSSLSSLLANQTRLVVSVVALLVIAVGGFMYATSTQTINSNAGTAEGDIIADAESCSVNNEAADLPEECLNLASSDEVVSTCAYELPDEQAVDCPEQAATATLGDTTSKFPMVWPIKTQNWPKITQPIANCDLLYSKDGNKTISTGIEIEVPAGTPVYAPAAGEVVYAVAGQGIVIVKTALKNSKGKLLYYALAHLSERSVSVGSKVTQNQLIARSGDAPGFELSHSLHFGVWTTGDFIGGHPLLNSATGKTLLTKMEHPMNYLPLDGRNVFSCKTVRPYVLPVSTGTTPSPTPTPTPTPGGTVNGMTFPLKTTKGAIRNKSIFSGGTTSRGGHPYIAYDIYVKNGTPVVSMTTGKVSKISKDVCGGTIVGIYNSGLNRRYSYMHLKASTVKVGVGRSVSPGTLLGYVGPTATSSCHTVDHLHIDAVKGSVRVSCARSNCPAANKKYFINIGPDLYKTYQKIPK